MKVERRLFIGLGILGFAGLLELVLLTTPVEPGCRAGGTADDPLVWGLFISIPILWCVALVLLVWGRERPWGRARFFALLGVAFLWPAPFTHLLGSCFQ